MTEASIVLPFEKFLAVLGRRLSSRNKKLVMQVMDGSYGTGKKPREAGA